MVYNTLPLGHQQSRFKVKTHVGGNPSFQKKALAVMGLSAS